MKHQKKSMAVAVILFLLTSGLFLFGLFDKVEYFISDALYSSIRPANQNIFVIGIDSDTLSQYGPWGSWSRQMTADLIRYLNEEETSKPAVIGIDIMFSGNTTDREDQALVDAVVSGGNVVTASQAYFSTEIDKFYSSETIQKYETPFLDLDMVSKSGMINIFADSDGFVRHGIYEYPYQGQNIMSFSAVIANIYTQKMGLPPIKVPPNDSNGQWYIPFAAKPGAYFGIGTKGTSWLRVMEGEIPRELFADSIVLIGPYASGMMDHYYTSADRSSPMYGIELHANMIQSMLEENYKTQMPGYVGIFLSFLLTVVGYLIFTKFSLKVWTLATILSCFAMVIVCRLIYQGGYILPVFYPLITLVLLYGSLLVTNSIMLTVEKASLYDQMQQLFIDCISTIANAIDAKDPCTSGHCKRVSEYSLLLGRGLHFSEEELKDLEYAALLHDVGKIGVSDGVLKKEGPLTDDEYAEMKRHPMLGSLILNEIQAFRGHITDGAKYHHERYDGKGYCEGIAGEEIPLFGRVIAIADAYDAMTQNRPYRRRLSKEIAIGELKKNSGIQFDPKLVEIFIGLMEEYPEIQEQPPVSEP